tara:strand:- start:157 stop:534 length:378 start_codon:yes stop_codon:yes gene_type:complete
MNEPNSLKTKIKNYFFEEKLFEISYIGKLSRGELILFIVNLLVFPAMFFQMRKTFLRKESADFNPFFVLLQLFGGAPEGFVGAVIGHMEGNRQQVIIGIYAMFYNAFMLFFRLFGKNGLIKPLYK